MYVDISEFVGKKVENIQIIDDKYGLYQSVVFSFSDGSVYKMYHEQDCCENVAIEEIV